MSVDAPGRLPASTSALFTQSLSVCPVQPILGAIDRIVAQRDGCSCSCSRTRRTARLRTSGENLFVVLLMAAPPSQELEPPANPGRFTPWLNRRHSGVIRLRQRCQFSEGRVEALKI